MVVADCLAGLAMFFMPLLARMVFLSMPFDLGLATAQTPQLLSECVLCHFELIGKRDSLDFIEEISWEKK